MAPRLLIVSNRLPVTATASRAGVTLKDSGGGLATGLRPWHERGDGRWIGWPGDVSAFSDTDRTEIDRALAARGIVPVHLSPDHVERYYHGFANGVVWPLFHYLVDRVPVDASGWDAYRDANALFADAVAREYRPGDTVWVHDFQLMLVPALVRGRCPDAAIGFFLHIPFPSSEVFRTLPWRRELLTGLLGADVVGFHTAAYLRHFITSLLHVDGIEADLDRVRIGGREVRLGVFPMGVDAASFESLAATPAVQALVDDIRRDAAERRILLGVDRLDYTKGIPRRLLAVERLLRRSPDLRDRIRFVQVAVPSRGGTDEYRRFRRQVEERVGRLNGSLGTLRSTPVHYVHRSVSSEELVALYRAADVMLVTPLRDGMNLVAKEFVAARDDEDGVLVLSEFAGAASELDGAVVVNPYDVDGVADAVRRALAMRRPERRARMRTMRRRVLDQDVHRWASEFLDALRVAAVANTPARSHAAPSAATALLSARRCGPCRLLLDYDGTLVPIARSPELASPDPALRLLLAALASIPAIDVEIVSGRPRHVLESWFGDLRIALWAEHGFWHRPVCGDWIAMAHAEPDWQRRLLPLLDQFTRATPGAHVEVKSAAVAWHFRGAQREFGARQAHELRLLLGDALSNQPLEVVEGKKVIEIRLRGVSKAVVARQPRAIPGETIVAFGDDRTDEDLFLSLPASALTIAVGTQLAGARYEVTDYREVRGMLAALVALPQTGLAVSAIAGDAPATNGPPVATVSTDAAPASMAPIVAHSHERA